MRSLLLILLASAAFGQRHVVVVGVDGLGGAMLGEETPQQIQELMDTGAWTLHGRGVLPTVSSPNWASMIMGAVPELHGVTSNDWQPDKFDIAPACKGPAGRFPTVFGLLHEQRPELRMAVFHDWQDFGRLIEPGVVPVLRHVEGSRQTMAAAIEYWKQAKPDLLFVHLDAVDHAGHSHGWSTDQYRKSVSAIGELLDELRGAISESGTAESTFLLLTADHGGTGTSHGHPTQRDLEIPWILNGPGVPAGHEIHALVRTIDTAATIASIFGVASHPCWTGKPVAEVLR
ncbi:alkaline phosphatase [uncultured Paludibaculum sp.]|uniref:alkaline phosphatase n=1 Tax=uncultured Paludibaculum sp. TaxID=1765020 RepID=UPI002AAB72CD|nr:alkaline phosphatase [uncultured Paludibaculum sp.]